MLQAVTLVYPFFKSSRGLFSKVFVADFVSDMETAGEGQNRIQAPDGQESINLSPMLSAVEGCLETTTLRVGWNLLPQARMPLSGFQCRRGGVWEMERLRARRDAFSKPIKACARGVPIQALWTRSNSVVFWTDI